MVWLMNRTQVVKLTVNQGQMIFGHARSAVDGLLSKGDWCSDGYAVYSGESVGAIVVRDNVGGEINLPRHVTHRLLFAKDRIQFVLQNLRKPELLKYIITNLVLGKYVRDDHECSSMEEFVTQFKPEIFMQVLAICGCLGIDDYRDKIAQILSSDLDTMETMDNFSTLTFEILNEMYLFNQLAFIYVK